MLDALKWLQKHNPECKHIIIVPENLNWMKHDEDMLPDKTVEEITEDDNIVSCTSKGNLIETKDDFVEASTGVFGYVEKPPTFNCPQRKDVEVTNALVKAYNNNGKSISMVFPYVSEVPVDEYDKTVKLFCKAFPWL